MYFNNYIRNPQNQARLDLGYAEWEKKFIHNSKSYYMCERSGCLERGNIVACLKCANTFYCSILCRNLDENTHKTICEVTNTRDMLVVDTYIGYKLGPILSLVAKAKYEKFGPGIINVRSYDSVWCFKKVPSDDDLQLFISYIPLDDWRKHCTKSGYDLLPVMTTNDYTAKMIVNFHLEDMNKPQLHRLPVCNLDTTDAQGLKDFKRDALSKLNIFQVPINT